MKKLFITMLSIVAILCTTACSDEKFATETEGEEMIEFTVQLSDGVDASRAISDGLTVEELYCEVYSMADPANPQRLTDLDQKVEKMGTTVNKDGLTVKTATIRMALVKGQAYNVLFWAQAPGAYNLIDANTNKTDLRNITVAPATANTESKDAFTAVYKTVKVTGPIKETIVLTRPFAQINFGTTVQDYEDALKAGIDFGAASKELVDSTLVSKIVASHGATIYDALTETSVDDGQGLTFGWAEVKEMVENEKLMVGGVEYKYLATAYMLVPGGYESNVSDIEMEIETGLNENITLAVPFAPVQRNYRTNVLGNLLTNTADFTIIVDPIYNTPDNNIEVDKTETVSTAAELQAAIDAAIVGNNVITFGADINGDVTRSATAASITVSQKEGVNIVINGAGYKFDGTFYLQGNSRSTGTETLTFSDIKFEHADGAIDFISCNNGGDGVIRYAHNVTVNNCTFSGNENGAVVGMRYRQCYNMSVLNSKFTNMFSVMWATGCDKIEIDGVEAECQSEGISVDTSAEVVVKNTKVSVAGDYGYALRAEASGAYKMNVSNSVLTADAPIVLRKTTGAYTLTLEGNNTLNSTRGYQIVVTGSDYKANTALTAPTGDFTLTGAEGMAVYPYDLIASTTSELATALAAAQSGAVIKVVPGEYKMSAITNKEITIQGSREAILDMTTIHDAQLQGVSFIFDGVTVNFGKDIYKGLKHTNSVKYTDCAINGLQFLYAPAEFEGCDLNSNGAEHCIWTYGSNNATFTDCDFVYGDRAVNCYSDQPYQATEATFTRCTFTKVEGKPVSGALETNSSLMVSLKLNISGCTVNEGDLWWVSEWDSKGGANTTVTVDDAVVFPVAFIGEKGYPSLNDALKAAVNGDEVKVNAGTYYPANAGGKNITVSAMENCDVTFKLRNQGEDGCDYGFGGNGTGVGTYVFNNITFDTSENTGNYKGYAYMGATYNNCDFVGAWSLNNANDYKFNNCTFDFKNGYFWTWGGNSVTFDGCTFNGNSKCILAHGYAATVININNCAFAATEKGYTGAGDNTAAVEIDPAGTNVYTINFTGNNTKTEHYAGWARVKDGSTGHVINGL